MTNCKYYVIPVVNIYIAYNTCGEYYAIPIY